MFSFVCFFYLFMDIYVDILKSGYNNELLENMWKNPKNN